MGRRNHNGNNLSKNLGGMKNLSTPILLQRASSISFNNPVGGSLSILQNGIIQSTAAQLQVNEPGVMGLYWLQTFGVANSASDPVNVYAGRIFTDIRRELSSVVTTYDAAEVLNYLMACDSLFSVTEWLYRLYGCLGNYVQENRYQPKTLVAAMGVDYNDVLQHISDLAFYINTVVARSKAMRLPKDFVIAQRHMNMSFSIFRDENIRKSQFYVYSPKYLYKYDAANNKMVTVDFHPSTPMTYATIVSKVDDIINSIIPDETLNCIAGDLRKVYPESSFWTLREMPHDFKVEPVYDINVLFEIHNANILDYESVDSLDITQQTISTYDVILKFDPTFTTDKAGIGLKRIIDIDADDPQAAAIASACRLKWTVKSWNWNKTTQKGTFKLASCGSEIILSASIFMYRTDTDNVIEYQYSQFPKVVPAVYGTTNAVFGFYGAANADAFNNWTVSEKVRSFNSYPIMFAVNTAQANTDPFYQTTFGRIDNYSLLEDSVLYKINEAILLDSYSIKV